MDSIAESEEVLILTGFREPDLGLALAVCTSEQNEGVEGLLIEEPKQDTSGDLVGKCPTCDSDHLVVDLQTAIERRWIDWQGFVSLDLPALIVRQPYFAAAMRRRLRV